mmetsp:Transcript_34519/g.67218  ORF Transcript_34519/g.67218 Transcript_34519/m.67218 type:complete len:286 (+) Transcript_34519:580-1437(+)
MERLHLGRLRLRVPHIREVVQARFRLPGPAVDAPLVLLGLLRAVAVAPTHLRREVVHVRVEVALGPAVGLARLHRVEPPGDARPALRVAQAVALVVEQAGVHALDVRREDHVRRRERLQEERAVRLGDLLLHGAQLLLEERPRLLVDARVDRRRAAEPHAPRAEQHALELAARDHLGLAHAEAQRPELVLQGLEDDVRLGDDPAVQLHGRQHAARDLLLVPALLLAVAKHGDLLDAVGDLHLLEPEPHLLAVGTPRVLVAVQHDANLRLGRLLILQLPEQPQVRL